jgi:1,5-anhydro-D-fructose reductase (1,5-anhydro-D-mannitol-forming)
MKPNPSTIRDPVTGNPLRYRESNDRPDFGYWHDGKSGTRWPVALGIPYLRGSKAPLAESVSGSICAGNAAEALASLLQDTDPFAPRNPDLAACRQIAEQLLHRPDSLGGREMMDLLQFGPVADYFALRGSAPTFFSGIGLLKAGHQCEAPVIEVACGAGHFLYWMRARGIDVVGIDAVFSKLCLAHYFLGIKSSRLVCAEVDSASGLPLAMSEPSTVFCHDAFYFFERKAEVLGDFRRLAGEAGSVLIGHAHLATADHGSVSGFPVTLADYRTLAQPSASFFDDASLAQVGAVGGRLNQNIPEDAEAISFIEGPIREKVDAAVWPKGECLHEPLQLRWDAESGSTKMDWPSVAFEREYAAASYLETNEDPSLHLPLRVGDGGPLMHPGLTVPAPFLRFGCRPLRWGIIGGGWIASDYFAPAFEFLPHAKLVALAEPRSERREAFRKIAAVETFENWQSMFANCALDAVYIATPNHTHAELIEAAASKGIRILCEKPLATNAPDLERIRTAAKAAPERFQTAFDQRYHPAHALIAQVIGRGDLGTITQLRIHYACWVGGDWGKVPDTDNWRIDRQRAGGGAGFDLLPHCIDLVRTLLDDPIDDSQLLYQHRVHPYATGDRGVDDGALVSARTKSGILVSIHVGYNCPENQPRRRIDISGTGGWLEAENTMGQDPGGKIRMEVAGEPREIVFPNDLLSGPFLRQLDRVSRIWINGREPLFPFADDLEAAGDLIAQDEKANQKQNKRTTL